MRLLVTAIAVLGLASCSKEPAPAPTNVPAPAAPTTGAAPANDAATAPAAPAIDPARASLPSEARVRDAELFPGEDLGARVNAASAALGTGPGTVRVSTPGTVRTPIRLRPEHALAFGPGVWRFAASPAITVDDACEVSGAGVHRTRLVLEASATGDLVTSADFGSLSGTPEKVIQQRKTRDPQLEGFDAGVKYVTIRDLTLRGNRRENPKASGAGIRLFGFWWTIRDVLVEQFAGDGIYTEWIAAADVLPDGNDAPEGWLSHVKILSNGRNGWTVNGPHDTAASGLMVANNGAWGIDVGHRDGHYSGGGLLLTNVHAYGNKLGGVRNAPGANVIAFGLESEGNGGPGLVLRSNDCVVHGEFYANAGPGVQLGEAGGAFAGANVLTIQSHNNGASQLAWENSAGGNQVHAVLHAESGQEYQRGGPTNHDTLIATVGGRGNAVAKRFQGGVELDAEGNVYGVRVLQFRDAVRLQDGKGQPRP
jgi:hypothetical protein